MTLSQICAQCTDRACHLCPVSMFSPTAPKCGICPNRTEGSCCHAAVRRIAAQDAELDLYYSDLDMDGGEL